MKVKCIRERCEDNQYAAKLCKWHYRAEFESNRMRFGKFLNEK